MNRALSDELKTTFFNIIPETRPFEGTWKITEGNWLDLPQVKDVSR